MAAVGGVDGEFLRPGRRQRLGARAAPVAARIEREDVDAVAERQNEPRARAMDEKPRRDRRAKVACEGIDVWRAAQNREDRSDRDARLDAALIDRRRDRDGEIGACLAMLPAARMGSGDRANGRRAQAAHENIAHAPLDVVIGVRVGEKLGDGRARLGQGEDDGARLIAQRVRRQGLGQVLVESHGLHRQGLHRRKSPPRRISPASTLYIDRRRQIRKIANSDGWQ
jgi:hypothetical protein